MTVRLQPTHPMAELLFSLVSNGDNAEESRERGRGAGEQRIA